MSNAKLLQAVGRHVVDYFYATGECLICPVDEAQPTANGDPSHQMWCPVRGVVHDVPEVSGPRPGGVDNTKEAP